MTTIELKTNFHKLIDNINNDDVLYRFYEILEKAKETKEGSLWARLSPNEQQELIMIEMPVTARNGTNPKYINSEGYLLVFEGGEYKEVGGSLIPLKYIDNLDTGEVKIELEFKDGNEVKNELISTIREPFALAI